MNFNKTVVLEAFNDETRSRIIEISDPSLKVSFPMSNDLPDLLHSLIDAEFVVVRANKFLPNWFEYAPKLRAIHQWGTGTDGLPIQEAKNRGIILARSPGVNAPSVADLTIALMLSVLRRLCVQHSRIQNGLWMEPNLYELGEDLTGKTVGLIGFGHIAQSVAKRLSGFDCKVVYFRPSGALVAPEIENAEYQSLELLLKNSDIVSLHCPLTQNNRNLIDAKAFNMMKDNAVIINTARGALIDHAALLEALQTNKIGGAGLDVFEHEPLAVNDPIRTAPNAVLMPHAAGGTRQNLERLVKHWSMNLTRISKGEPIALSDLVT